jgi:hypothetical protein
MLGACGADGTVETAHADSAIDAVKTAIHRLLFLLLFGFIHLAFGFTTASAPKRLSPAAPVNLEWDRA